MSEDTKQSAQQQQQQKDRTVQFNQYLNKRCHITFGGHREIVGVIVGWDTLNLVIDDAVETRTFSKGQTGQQADYTRKLGQILVRAQQVSSIFPEDGYAPYIAPVTDEEAVPAGFGAAQ